MVCGGYQRQEDMIQQNCYWYNADSNMWNNRTDLLETRSSYALGQLNNDDFWVLGNLNKSSRDYIRNS